MRPAMKRERIAAVFFFAVLLFLLYQLYRILAPFFGPLVLAGVLAITLNPLTRRVRGVLGGRRTLAGLLMTLGVMVMVLLPAVFGVGMLADEATAVYDRVEAMRRATGDTPLTLSGSWAADVWRKLVEHLPVLARVDTAALSRDLSHRVSGWIAGEAGDLLEDLASTLVDLSMLLVALFFFFRDGDRMAQIAHELIPMQAVHDLRIQAQLYETVSAVVQSSVLIAVLQALVAGLGYFLIGHLPVSALLAFFTGLASFVPMVGAALVWLPTALYLLVTGELMRGGLLILWGFVAVTSVDNFVRPLVIGGRVQIPTFLLLFALFGGLQVYGFLGIFLAPVVVGLLLAFLEIYRELFADEASAEPLETAAEP
jgi:predicted PurR-regulated permease PerM